MILRRVGQGIKNQDWFVVMIELVVVVLGIYIGLQVDDWNKARQDRQLENRYLERIAEDLDADLAMFEMRIQSYERRMARARFLLQSAEDPTLIEQDPTYFIQSIEYAGYTFVANVSDHTFEEIKGSGRLLLIQNEEIRGGLAAYYSGYKGRDQFNFIVQDIQLRYLNYAFGILTPEQQILMGSFSPDPTFSLEEARAAYTRMMAKPDFLEWIPKVIQSKTRTIEVLKRFRVQAQNLAENVAIELGREPKE